MNFKKIMYVKYWSNSYGSNKLVIKSKIHAKKNKISMYFIYYYYYFLKKDMIFSIYFFERIDHM